MRFRYFVESVRDPQQGSRRRFTDVTSWGKITPVRCRLLELPLGVKMTAALMFYINWMFNLYISYFSSSKIFVKRANSVPTS